ncbi:hypothetical protein ACPC54_18310 [Kitasatospora sp. NPDC094028]
MTTGRAPAMPEAVIAKKPELDSRGHGRADEARNTNPGKENEEQVSTEERTYTVTWTIDVTAATPAEAALEAADLMRGGSRREADEFEVFDVQARTATSVDLVTGTIKAIPYGPRVDVVVDHDHGGTNVSVFVDGRLADPDDPAGPAAWHIVDPGPEDEMPGHAWYQDNVDNRPETPRAVRELVNRLAMDYHRCGAEEDCAASDPDGVAVIPSGTPV